MSNWRPIFFKLYSGGPKYHRPRTKTFFLENWELRVELPGGRLPWREHPQPVNYAYRSLFKNSDVIGVPTCFSFSDSWSYGAPLRVRLVQAMSGMFDPLGVAHVCFDILKVRDGKGIEKGRAASLKEYIAWEYHDFLETPPSEGRNNGYNYKRRNEELQILKNKGESYRRQYDLAMERYLKPHPQAFDVRQIACRDWLFYTVGDYAQVPKYCYALPLEAGFYLHVTFDYQLEFYGKKVAGDLIPEMRRLEEWVMPRLRLMEIAPELNAPAPAARLSDSKASD